MQSAQSRQSTGALERPTFVRLRWLLRVDCSQSGTSAFGHKWPLAVASKFAWEQSLLVERRLSRPAGDSPTGPIAWVAAIQSHANGSTIVIAAGQYAGRFPGMDRRDTHLSARGQSEWSEPVDQQGGHIWFIESDDRTQGTSFPGVSTTPWPKTSRSEQPIRPTVNTG